MQKFHLNIRTLFYCESGQTLEQAAESSCSASTLGGIQDPTGHGPKYPGLADPALSRGLGTRQSPEVLANLNNSVILQAFNFAFTQ